MSDGAREEWWGRAGAGPSETPRRMRQASREGTQAPHIDQPLQLELLEGSKRQEQTPYHGRKGLKAVAFVEGGSPVGLRIDDNRVNADHIAHPYEPSDRTHREEFAESVSLVSPVNR